MDLFHSFVLVAVFVVVNLFIAVVTTISIRETRAAGRSDRESAHRGLLEAIETVRHRLAEYRGTAPRGTASASGMRDHGVSARYSRGLEGAVANRPPEWPWQTRSRSSERNPGDFVKKPVVPEPLIKFGRCAQSAATDMLRPSACENENWNGCEDGRGMGAGHTPVTPTELRF